MHACIKRNNFEPNNILSNLKVYLISLSFLPICEAREGDMLPILSSLHIMYRLIEMWGNIPKILS